MRQAKEMAEEIRQHGGSDVKVISGKRVDFIDASGYRASYRYSDMWGWRYVRRNKNIDAGEI